MTGNDRAAWLERRRHGLGASDAAAVCGLSPYAGPCDVYLSKVEPDYRGPDSEAMRWGLRLEPAIAQAYEEETGCQLARAAPALTPHPSIPWLFASLDRARLHDGRPVELKTARTPEGWGEPGTDEVPEGYLVQVQHQMCVTGTGQADVAVLIGGSDFRIYTVPRNQLLIDSLLHILGDFWERVVNREPPPIDWTDPRTPDLLDRLYRPRQGEELQYTSEEGATLMMLADAYEELGPWLAEKRAQREDRKAQIVSLMRTAAVAHLPDGRTVSRKIVSRKAYNVPETSYVDFRIKQPKERP